MIGGVLLGQATERTFIEIGRAQAMTQWWHWIALLASCLVLLAFVVMTYRRDSAELPIGMRLLLTLLRIAAFAGLLLFFLQIEKRTEKKITKNSRVAILVDTSQSMALQDVEPVDGPGQKKLRRIDDVSRGLGELALVEQLRKHHEVSVYRFGQDEKPTEILAVAQEMADDAIESPTEMLKSSLREARRLVFMAIFFLAIAAIGLGLQFVLPKASSFASQAWGVLIAVVCLIVSLVTLGVCTLRNPEIGLAQLFGAPIATNEVLSESTVDSETNGIAVAAAEKTETIDGSEKTLADINWSEELLPRGIKTRLGDALRFVIEKERGGSLAGVVTMTDGNVNAGADPIEVAMSASETGIPFYSVGVGSDQQPVNVRVADIEAPARVFPGDAFTLRTFVQAFGLANQRAKVELFSRDSSKSPDDETKDEFLEEREILLPPDGEALPVEFELTPSDIGRSNYVVRVRGPEQEIDRLDNEQSVNVRIVDRQNRILMIAGGPMRDYRFLRTQAYRDREILVDVLLQSSPRGASQEADKILTTFPDTREQMYEYDCVCAFDPDWEQLSADQLELLEDWVATQAGGLIVVAGPVHTPEWSSRRRTGPGLNVIKSLYPVTFYSRASITLGRGAYEAEEPTKLRFTKEGRSARFLWLKDSAVDSEAAWDRFDGVYGYQPIRDIKKAAKVYARFGSPEASIDGELPAFMAGHFYGSGRVFYLGSGEMWRLRAVDTAFFEQFYTRLIRYVSEGRLLRDSNRGILLLDKDRCSLGETVTIRASLNDTQFQPLTAEEVTASILMPDGKRKPITLRRLQESARDGVYVNQLIAATEGDYRIELMIPDNERLEVLTRELRVRVPDVEIERPQRNDALLSELSRRTGGKYFVGVDQAMRTNDAPGSVENATKGESFLCSSILPQDQETYLPGTPDLDFERRLMSWLLVLICGALCLEWLLRRLYKLA